MAILDIILWVIIAMALWKTIEWLARDKNIKK